MAIKEIFVYNNGLGELVRDFICDTAADVAKLPKIGSGVVPGSTALCLEESITYILSPLDTWEIKAYPKADLIGGKVPAEQLPSYVDDVMEFPSFAEFPVEGEEDKIYVDIDAKGATYRWSGTMYIPLQPALVDGGEWA